MALVRVAQYSSTPGPVTDYQAQNAHLQAFTNQLLTQQFILDSGTGQPVIKQGCYVSHGGSLYIADADTAITGSPSDGSVYIRVSGTTTLTVEFINNISGYTWNPVYTALTSGSYTILPYLIVKASTVWTRYNFNPNNQQFGSLASLAVTGNATVGGTLGVTGAISGATINTGQGATKVHLMNQNLRTTDSPTFATINTGQGANELYPMNQAVRTTDSPTFASVDTGFGANEVYKITEETIAFGDVDNTDKTMSISSMDIKEFRMVNTTGSIISNSGNRHLYLNLPAGGTYFVVGQSDYSAQRSAVAGGVFSGGTTVAQVYNNSVTPIPFIVGLIVRRIS